MMTLVEARQISAQLRPPVGEGGEGEGVGDEGREVEG